MITFWGSLLGGKGEMGDIRSICIFGQ